MGNNTKRRLPLDNPVNGKTTQISGFQYIADIDMVN